MRAKINKGNERTQLTYKGVEHPMNGSVLVTMQKAHRGSEACSMVAPTNMPACSGYIQLWWDAGKNGDCRKSGREKRFNPSLSHDAQRAQQHTGLLEVTPPARDSL